MRLRSFLLGASALLLSSCGAIDRVGDWMDAARSTASGAVSVVHSVFEFGKSAKETAETTVEDLQHRAALVQSGVQLMLEGKELIEGAVK